MSNDPWSEGSSCNSSPEHQSFYSSPEYPNDESDLYSSSKSSPQYYATSNNSSPQYYPNDGTPTRHNSNKSSPRYNSSNNSSPEHSNDDHLNKNYSEDITRSSLVFPDHYNNNNYSPPQSPPISPNSAISCIRHLCDEATLLTAAKRVASQQPSHLCYKDPDGDTCYMIVVCKPSNSQHFYENLFVLQQHLQKLRLCCDQVLDPDLLFCPHCGSPRDNCHSPLSEKNNVVCITNFSVFYTFLN